RRIVKQRGSRLGRFFQVARRPELLSGVRWFPGHCDHRQSGAVSKVCTRLISTTATRPEIPTHPVVNLEHARGRPVSYHSNLLNDGPTHGPARGSSGILSAAGCNIAVSSRYPSPITLPTAVTIPDARRSLHQRPEIHSSMSL